MTRRYPLPDHLARIPFDRAALRAARVTEGRLRDLDVLRPYHGVQSTTMPSTVLERCRAYAVRLREGQCFSHVTAAQLLGIPMPGVLERRTVLDVSAVMPAAEPRTRGVQGHRLRRRPAVLRHLGLPITTPPETWCQLASLLLDDDLVIAADHVLQLRPHEPERAHAALVAAIARARSSDRARLSAALAEARPGSRSPGETRTRLLLMRAGLPEPLLNVETRDERGAFLGSPDLSWPDRRVGLEYEGGHHFADVRQYRYDVGRYEAFRDAGWTIVRVIDDDLRGQRARLLVARMQRLLA